MKSTGIVRRVDELGRIVLSISLRNRFEITEKDEAEWSKIHAQKVYISKNTDENRKCLFAKILSNGKDS